MLHTVNLSASKAVLTSVNLLIDIFDWYFGYDIAFGQTL